MCYHGRRNPWASARYLGFALVLVGCLAPPPVRSAAIQPHRATYELELSTSRADSSVVNAEGLMEFEWSDACDAWTVSQRARMEVGHSDGNVAAFGWVYNAWESKDGKRYRFFIRRIFGGTRSEEVRGEASLDSTGGPGRARFTLPEEREVALPKGTMFPSQHTLELLDRLKEGNMPHWRTVFDGTTDDGLFGISAALAESLPKGESASLDTPLLDDQPSWRLLIAFFAMDEALAEPEQEQVLRLFANGVSDQLTFDYGEFSVRARLTGLERLPDAGC